MIPRDENGQLLCSYCRQRAVLHQSSAFLYSGRDYGPVWHCAPCSAWVGCHPGGSKPLGRLANAALRRAKSTAHSAFDRLWKAKMKRDGVAKGKARGLGYKWLAEQMDMTPADCHIGHMDEAQCMRVVEICRPYGW